MILMIQKVGQEQAGKKGNNTVVHQLIIPYWVKKDGIKSTKFMLHLNRIEYVSYISNSFLDSLIVLHLCKTIAYSSLLQTSTT